MRSSSVWRIRVYGKGMGNIRTLAWCLGALVPLCLRAPSRIVRPMRTILISLLLLAAQAPPATLPVVRKTIQIADGRTVSGRVLNEGMSDLQLLTDDQRVHLLRKIEGDRYREVTSQKDWPTYHGDVGG